MTAVFHPALARAIESGLPPCPVPITIASYVVRFTMKTPKHYSRGERERPGARSVDLLIEPRVAHAPPTVMSSRHDQRMPPILNHAPDDRRSCVCLAQSRQH